MSAAAPPPVVSVAVIGAGPRGVGVLERIAANLDELGRAGESLVVHLIDPHPAGPGRIWRYEQSPLLKLNSMAADVTMFTDETSTIDGPVRPGPSLVEWAERVRQGGIRLPRGRLDAALTVELEHLGPASFPTRRLQSLYLRWFYEQAVEALGGAVEVQEHRGLVRRASEGPDGRQRLELDDGEVLAVDLVLYSLGHTGAEPEPEHASLIDFAHRRELYYLPPAFTADADTRPIVPGQRVIVRGFGLAAVDLTVLLTEGRGGRFVRDGAGADAGAGSAGDGPGVGAATGRLRYEPSGREPRIVIGSRRGVPYHSKIGSTLVGEPPVARFFTPAIAAALEASRESLDFAADIWPLIGQEMLWGYYRELFTGHPERVTLDWASFGTRFEKLDPRASLLAASSAGREPDPAAKRTRGHALPTLGDAAEEARVRADAAALTALIESAVPDELDRLFLPELDRPLEGLRVGSTEELQDAVRAYIDRDLRLRTRPEHSATLGLFVALLTALFAFAELISSPKWTARSRVEDIHGWWLGYFSFIASGPPAHRLEELLALSEAGVVDFLGGEMWLEADEEAGVFRAGGVNDDRVVTATALVDARLPDTSIARSDNELLRLLVETGAALEEVAHDEGYRRSTGRLSVRPDDRRVLHGTGSPSGRSYAIGPYTNSPFVGAFSRPRTNAVSFRENDRVARALLRHAGELAAERREAAAAGSRTAGAAVGSGTPGDAGASGTSDELPPPGGFTDRLWGEFAAEPAALWGSARRGG